MHIEPDKLAHGFVRQPRLTPEWRAGFNLLLLEPKSTRGMRKRIMEGRSNVIVPRATIHPLNPAVKFARKLTTLTLQQLINRQRQFARRASTAKHMLDKMSGTSRVRSRMSAVQDSALASLGQVTAEIKARNLAASGWLAPATV